MGVEKKIAKKLMLRLCFFGTFKGFCIDNKLGTLPEPLFITAFQAKLQEIAEKTKERNPSLYETARKLKDAKDGKNYIGSFYALFLQEYEFRVVEKVMLFLMNQTPVMNHPTANTDKKVGVYEYDGVKLLKENVDKFGKEALVSLLNNITYDLTGFRLTWEEKEIESEWDLDEWIEAVEEDEKPNEGLVADMTEISSAIDNSDCGIIETIIKIKPQHYIFSVDKNDGSKGEWYGWNDTRWEKSDAPLKKAIMYNVPEYWRGLMEKWDEVYEEMTFEEGELPDCNYLLWKRTKKRMDERIFMLKSAGGMTACVSVAKTLMANYTLEFDAKEDLFGCENGVLDFAEECFRPYRFDDFITYSCGYDYTPSLIGFKVFDKENQCREVSADDLTEDFNASFALIMETYEQIFPDEELRNYFFKIIATGLSGRAIEKFFVFNGAGRNGKGLTNEFLEKVLGSYFVSVSPTIFSENQKNKSSAGANPEIAKLDKKRYIVSKEPQKDAPLHNNIIKDLTGGGNTSARMLYSSKTQVKLCGTNVMECNEKPPFSEAPKDADAERINDILFGSFFTGEEDKWDMNTGETNSVFPLDAGLKERLKGSVVHKNTMLNILIHNLLQVKSQGYNVDFFRPESVKQRSLAYLQNSYDLHNIFKSIFERRVEENVDRYVNWKNEVIDADWSLAKIAQAVRKAPEFYDLPKSKQKEYKAEVIEDFFRKNNFYKTSVYTDTHKHTLFMRDWRLKPDVEDEE
jgi:phage/plasmid-associated DNA primase